MAGKSRQSWEKRNLEKQRQEKQAAKRARRQAGRVAQPDDAPEVDHDELLERFRLLNEGRAAGTIDDEQFAIEEHEILVALGVADPDGP